MSLATVGNKATDEQSLGELLTDVRKNIQLIENHDARISQEYKGLIIDTTISLERLSVLVATLHLFSNNETIDDVSTETIKFMLVNAFQGFVHQQHYDFENRKAHVLAAKEYFKDFHHLCQLYGLAEKTNFDANRMTNPVQESNRMEKIQKYQDKKRLETLLEEMENRTHVEEEVQREIYLSLVKLWVMKCEENCTISTVMKPFILVKSELQKRVFGAGYPSLPTMTLDEFYDEEMVRMAAEAERQLNEPKPVEPEDPDEETEESLGKARAWDEWKDTHRRGEGNRHNRS
ncbi:immunoglobulin-binding protein 1-like [Bolinopsis microptera]|uniref:immunoglobulin-binding protein 1-like n=1 Tax=Bolinopsis microptera TaxID=2820187 RepID=UPI00307AA905